MIELPGIWSLSPLAALIGILVLLFWFLSSGRLITKSSHERELGVKQEQVDDWKSIAKENELATAIYRDQNTKLIEAGTAATAFFRAHTPVEEFGGK